MTGPSRIAAMLVAMVSGACAEEPVSFRADIAPLLQRRCATCHGEENAKGRYRLDSFANLSKAGESDQPPVVPGKPRESEIYRLLTEPDATDRMPQKADALPSQEIALVARWIAEGAIYDGGSARRPLVELARDSMLRPAPEHYTRPAPVTALAFSPDGAQLAVSGYYEVTIWNAADGSLARRIGGLPERITALAWHAGRNVLAVAGGSPSQWGSVALVEPSAESRVRFLCDLADTALSVAFSPDGSRIVTGGADRTIRLFDTASGKQQRVVRQHADWVQSVAFSPDGARIVSASRDRTVRIFDAATGELEKTYSGHEVPVVAALFVTSNTVLSLGRGKIAHLWEAASAKDSKTTIVFGSDVQQIAASPFGVIAGGVDHCVRVYRTSDRAELFALAGHGDVVQALAVAPSGDTFASGSAEGVVCVWNLACETWAMRFTARP